MKLLDPAALSASSKEAVRLSFNPSGQDRVYSIKLAAASLIHILEEIRAEGIAAREASIAITEIETATMWAVKAATKNA